MKKSRLLGAVCASILCFIAISPHAALVDNGSGLIYDTVLGITWAQPDDLRTWDEANAWAASLTLGGATEWRLPYIDVTAGTGPYESPPVDCSTATELLCCRNELIYVLLQS